MLKNCVSNSTLLLKGSSPDNNGTERDFCDGGEKYLWHEQGSEHAVRGETYT